MRRVLLRSRSMPRKARGREACSGVNSTTGAARKGREWKGGKQMQGAQSSTTVLRLCVRSHPPPGPSRISVAGAAAARENPLKATVDGGTEQERGPLQLVEEAEDPSSTSRRRWWWEGRETGGRSSAPPPLLVLEPAASPVEKLAVVHPIALQFSARSPGFGD